MKYYVAIPKESGKEYFIRPSHDFFISISELLSYIDYWNYELDEKPLNFVIAEATPIKNKKPISKEDCRTIEILSVSDLIKEYHNVNKKGPLSTKKKLIKVILDHDDSTEEDILSILSELSDLETGLIMRSTSPKITEKTFSKIIETVDEYFRFLDLINNPRITEPLLEKIIKEVLGSRILNKEEKTNAISHIAKKSNVSPIFLKKLFEITKYCQDIVYYKVFFEIICNPQTDSELLNEIVVFIGKHCSIMNDGVSKVICKVARNPKTLIKSLEFIFLLRNNVAYQFRPSMAVSIINNPNVDEKLLKLIAEKFDNYFALKAIIKNPKVTSNIIFYIISKLEIIDSKDKLISDIVKCPKIDEKSLEKLIEICTVDEIKILSECEILSQITIDNLYEKVNKSTDTELLEKLLNLEKVVIGRMCEDNTCDNKINVRKEYLKVLNRYLKSENLEIKLKVLEVMVKEGYLTTQNIVDKDYIKECPRTLKLCSLLSKI